MSEEEARRTGENFQEPDETENGGNWKTGPEDDLDENAGISNAEKNRRKKIQEEFERAQQVEQQKREQAVTDLPGETVSITVASVGGIIGRGHHSNVYRAELAGSHKVVALKIDYRNLEREYPHVLEKVKALREIENEHIQRLIEFVPDWEKNRSYMVLDYIPGVTLQQTLYDRKESGGEPFPQARALNWAVQLLDALEYLHGKNLVHGDINLSNIMLRPKKGTAKNGDEEHEVCLIDFNWAAPDLMGGETRTEIQTGDPKEQVIRKTDNAEEFDRGIRRDIYHVGAVMYQLLTGEVPDPDRGRAALVSEEKATDAAEKRRKLKENGVTDNVAEIILKAVSTDPMDRYRSAAEMREAMVYLPLTDTQTERKVNRAKSMIAAACACFAAGLLLFMANLHLYSRFVRMQDSAAKAAAAVTDGRYSDALRLGCEAVDGLFVPTEGQEVLSEILGAGQSGAGYQYWWSLSVGHRYPVRARLSPDGSWLSVLVKPSGEDAETSEILAYHMEGNTARTLPAVGGWDDFAFLNHDTILYIDGSDLICYDLQSGRQEWSARAEVPDLPDVPPAALAVSGSGTRAAVLYPESGAVYILNTTKGNLWKSVSLAADAPAPQALPRRIFLLDEEGTTLAVSLSGTEVRVYDISGSEAVPVGNNLLTETDNDYTHYEGGFYGSWLLFTAFAEDEYGMRGERHRINVDELRSGADDHQLDFSDQASYHVRTDENGLFLTVGNQYRRLSTTMLDWGPPVTLDGEILLLEHMPDDDGGRLLLSIRRELSVMDDSGAKLASLSLAADAAPWNLGTLSGEWLVLTGTARQTLSILRWAENRGARTDLKTMRKEADERLKALSAWDGRTEEA